MLDEKTDETLWRATSHMGHMGGMRSRQIERMRIDVLCM